MKKIILYLSIFFIGINVIEAKEKVTLSSCVDGDTIKILLKNEEKIYTVRMLAIDTPESVHPQKEVEYYGKEASEYTCELVTNAKKIEIEYDENSDKLDKYERLLVWVFVDGELLQKKLIENGYAKVAYLYDDYKYTEELLAIQEKTSAKNIGIWNSGAQEKYDNQDKEKSFFTIKKEIKSFLDTIKTFNKTDYIVFIFLILIIIFSSNKTLKNKIKKIIKEQFKQKHKQ